MGAANTINQNGILCHDLFNTNTKTVSSYKNIKKDLQF